MRITFKGSSRHANTIEGDLKKVAWRACDADIDGEERDMGCWADVIRGRGLQDFIMLL